MPRADRELTPAEAAFLTTLRAEITGLDDWPCKDEDGSPWLMVSLDFLDEDRIRDTLRLDFDESGKMLGGWSRYCLNGDDGVRAERAGVETGPPDGLEVEAPAADPGEMARLAAAWFARHVAQWPGGPRAARRRR